MIAGAQIRTHGQPEMGGRIRTLVLGAELWALALGLPALEHGADVPWGFLLFLPPFMLGLGESLRRRAPRLSRLTLLAGFPTAIALGSAARPALAAEDPWAGVVAPLVAVSVLLYLAVALHSFARPAPTRATGWQPVPEAAWTRAASRALSTGVLMTTLAAGVVITAVIPFAARRDVLETRFPLAADDARTLAVALGGGLLAIALAAVVGPGLRARRVGDLTRERVAWSVTLSLGIAALAALAYAWLVRAI